MINRRSLLKSILLGNLMGATGAILPEPSLGGEELETAPATAMHFTAPDRIWIAMENRLILAGWPDLCPLQSLRLPTDKILALGSASGSTSEPGLFVAGGIPGETGHLFKISMADLQVQWKREAGLDVLRCLDASPTRGQIATGSHDRKIYVWDLEPEASEPSSELTDHTGPVTGLLFLNAEQLVSASHDQTLRVWQLQEQRVLRSLQQHAGAIEGLTRLPDSGSGLPQCLSYARDKTARIWQPTIGRQVRLARLPTTGLSAVLDQDPQVAWIGGDRGEAYAIDLQTVQVLERRRLANSPLFSMARPAEQSDWLAGSARGITSLQKPASRE